jgi:hypothetical protein
MKLKPAFIVREGSSSVTAYKFPRNQFCLRYRKHAGAARTREVRTGERAARNRASEIAIALANGCVEILELTNADRDSYLNAKSLLPAGVPLHEAVEAFLRLRSRRGPSATLPEIFAQFIRTKETMLRNGELSEVRVEKMRADLAKFVTDFPGPIGDYYTDDLQDWLNARCDKKRRPVGSFGILQTRIGTRSEAESISIQLTCYSLAPTRASAYASSVSVTICLSSFVSGSSAFNFGGRSRYSATPIGLLASRRVYSTTVLFLPRQSMMPMVGPSCAVLTRLSTAAW